MRYAIELPDDPRGARKAFEIIVEAQYGINLVGPNLGYWYFDAPVEKHTDIAAAFLSVYSDHSDARISDMSEGTETTYPRNFRARKTGDDR